MSLISTTHKQIASLPWPALCLVLALATPPEASILVGSFRLSAYRIVLLAALIPSVWQLASGYVGRLMWSDGLIFFHGSWATLALVKDLGPGQGLESGGIYFVEAVGAYLIGRCFVRNARHVEALAALMMVIVVVMMGFAAMESITGHHLIREASRSVFGGPSLVAGSATGFASTCDRERWGWVPSCHCRPEPSRLWAYRSFWPFGIESHAECLSDGISSEVYCSQDGH